MLIHELQLKTDQGVRHTMSGLQKTDQAMQLSNAVKDALRTILDSATRSSTRATNTRPGDSTDNGQ
jgi:methyl-accepting chemotaxis protein